MFQFSLAAAVVALVATPLTADAFAPLKLSATTTTGLPMAGGATETKTYTFTKSDEIFAEAKTVRMCDLFYICNMYAGFVDILVCKVDLLECQLSHNALCFVKTTKPTVDAGRRFQSSPSI